MAGTLSLVERSTIARPDLASHSLTVRSWDEDVTTYLLFGLKAAPVTPPPCPLSTESSAPSFTRHVRAVRSWEAVTID